MPVDLFKNENAIFTVEQIHYYPFHIKPELRIFYVFRGSIEIINVSGNILLNEGDIEFISINEPAEIVGLTDDNLIIVMAINQEYIKKYDETAINATFNVNAVQFFPFAQRNLEFRNIENAQKLKMIFLDIFNDFCQSASRRINPDNLRVIILFSLKCFNDVIKHLNCLPRVDEHLIQRFLKMENYMLVNLGEKIKLNDLATVEYLSPQYLSAEYRNRFNRTFGSILEYYRIRKAVTMMLNKDMKTTQIINECGFSDSKYFYRAFKKHMRCTPAEFRKKINNNTVITKYYDVDSKGFREYLRREKESTEKTKSWVDYLNLTKIQDGYYIGDSMNVDGLLHRYCLFTDIFIGEITLDSDECWYYHDGMPVEIERIITGEKVFLSSVMSLPHEPRIVLKKNERVKIILNKGKGYTLISRVAFNK